MNLKDEPKSLEIQSKYSKLYIKTLTIKKQNVRLMGSGPLVQTNLGAKLCLWVVTGSSGILYVRWDFPILWRLLDEDIIVWLEF